jgi:hypothetical protein
MENASRGSGWDAAGRRGEFNGGARHDCSGEQLPRREGVRERGKRPEKILTSTRSSYGARSSREGGETAARHAALSARRGRCVARVLRDEGRRLRLR